MKFATIQEYNDYFTQQAPKLISIYDNFTTITKVLNAEPLQYIFNNIIYPKEWEYLSGIGCDKKIPFGSTVPIDYPSPFERLVGNYDLRKRPNVGPTTYDAVKIDSKIVSPKGLSVFASTVERFQKVQPTGAPGPGAYEVPCTIGHIKTHNRKIKKMGFSSTTSRKPLFVCRGSHPGPGYYDVEESYKKREIPKSFSFNGPAVIEPYIEIRCSPNKKDFCSQCSAFPQSYYWIHQFSEKVMCDTCFERTKKYATRPSAKLEFNFYRRARYCDFVHSHEGTTAAVPVAPLSKIKKAILRESYFAKYPDQRPVKQRVPARKSAKTCRKGGEVKTRSSDQTGIKGWSTPRPEVRYIADTTQQMDPKLKAIVETCLEDFPHYKNPYLTEPILPPAPEGWDPLKDLSEEYLK